MEIIEISITEKHIIRMKTEISIQRCVESNYYSVFLFTILKCIVSMKGHYRQARNIHSYQPNSTPTGSKKLYKKTCFVQFLVVSVNKPGRAVFRRHALSHFRSTFTGASILNQTSQPLMQDQLAIIIQKKLKNCTN